MKIYEDYEAIEKSLKNISIDDYKYCLNFLEDDISKKLYYYRVMVDNTDDPYYGLMLAKNGFESQGIRKVEELLTYRLIKFLLSNNNYKKKIYMFGDTMEHFLSRTIIWQCFDGMDNLFMFDDEGERDYDQCGKNLHIKPINKFFEEEIPENVVFIIGNPKYIFLKESLKDSFVYDLDASVNQCGEQYFEETICPYNDNEVIVDCGTYDLTNVFQYNYWLNGKYKKIYGFEPIKSMYNTCLNLINEYNLDRIEMFNIGLWDKKEEKPFSISEDNSASRFDKDSNYIVHCDTLDNLLIDKDVSVIKMDIEGSEKEALLGCKNIIKNNKPKLLICVYHKPNDIVNIIKLVKSIRSDYKVYIRHYGSTIYETVAYFV